LASLYEQLEDKSRILLEKKVVEIKHEGNEVVVRCQDGSEFRGDLVVGADGIHSRTRVEMQRYAEETGPRGLMDRDKSSKSMKGNAGHDMQSPRNTSSLFEKVRVLDISKLKHMHWDPTSCPDLHMSKAFQLRQRLKSSIQPLG
jgi:2-polyprenyl-6-methoxyphenol hydroxylase-like FAD-dependent oxidoreductase